MKNKKYGYYNNTQIRLLESMSMRLKLLLQTSKYQHSVELTARPPREVSL